METEQSNTYRRLTVTEIAAGAIEMYLEYLGYGYDEDQAKARAILEVVEGDEATDELNAQRSRS